MSNTMSKSPPPTSWTAIALSGRAVQLPEWASRAAVFSEHWTCRTVRPESAQLRKKPSLTWFVEDEFAQTSEIDGIELAPEAIVVVAPPASPALDAIAVTAKE